MYDVIGIALRTHQHKLSCRVQPREDTAGIRCPQTALDEIEHPNSVLEVQSRISIVYVPVGTPKFWHSFPFDPVVQLKSQTPEAKFSSRCVGQQAALSNSFA